MDEDEHYDLFVAKEGAERKVMLRVKVGDAQAVLMSKEISGESVVLEADSTSTEYSFYVRDGETREFLGSARTQYLSSEVAGGFTGVVMGLYAVDEEGRWAEFKDLYWKQG